MAQGGDWGSVVTDAMARQALEDGVLVKLHYPVLFQGLPINRMTQHLFDDLTPFVEAEATLFNGDFYRALTSILRTKCSFATGDVSGWTAMYPEDY